MNNPRQLTTVGLTMLAVMVLGAPAEARLDPLRVITERINRSEILIVVDTSGSMAWRPNPADVVGNDCTGDRNGSVDLCGDGLCSGSEGTSWNACREDCPVTNTYNATPGDTPVCHPYYPHTSRMVQVKRVLQNLLPDMRQTSSVGLVTFAQWGYFRYYKGITGSTTRRVTVFFSETEMKYLGGWDSDSESPRSSFTWNGTTFTLLSASGLPVNKDSLYSRTDDLSVENRFAWSTAKRLFSDGRNSWDYKGSYYTYTQLPMDTTQLNIEAEYHGPQFVDSLGQTWVYHRYNYDYSSQGITAGNDGIVVEPLAATDTATDLDATLFRVMSRLNAAKNGGLWATGGTPTAAAVHRAEDHFVARQLGTGTYSTVGPDLYASCRPRYVLLLTDGQATSGYEPAGAVKALYENTNFAGNPIKTLVVGLPGLPSAAVDQLDAAADMGDDGLSNNSSTALYAADEAALLRVIKEALFQMVQGDYTTTPAGVTTSGNSPAVEDIGLVSSTEYPGWRGHLKALDFTEEQPREVWDAGYELSLMPYTQRKIYTGLPTSNGGAPVPLFSEYGAVNMTGGCEGCGPVGLRQLWDALGGRPTDHEILQVAEWIAGKNRPWKMGPSFRSTPASVGTPPILDAEGHSTFRRINASRERLIYVTTNDGVLHAFRTSDGTEAFAYIPPNLLPKIYRLWQKGGHDPDPKNFEWILASSPRVEDMPPRSSTGNWTTELTLTMGPGGEDFVILDITNPSQCKVSTCELNDPPFRVVAHSHDLTMVDSVLGQTWSVPVMFYDYPDKVYPQGRYAMGSGYGTGYEGHYYNYFPSIFDAPISNQHSDSGALVEFATLANTVAAVDPDNGKQIVATYQADLRGNIVRYDKGDARLATPVISAGQTEPFYYSPAVMYMANGTVLMAASSGAQDETDPQGTSETRLYLRQETGGVVDASRDVLSCKVSEICTGKTGCPQVVPENCAAPSSKARPVSAPLLAHNEFTDGETQYEAFYLVYDPPSQPCSSGSSWLIRISTDGADQRLLAATRYAGVRATGVSLAGGGLDLAVTQIGTDGNKAWAFTIMGNVRTASLGGTAPYVETWREVR